MAQNFGFTGLLGKQAHSRATQLFLQRGRRTKYFILRYIMAHKALMMQRIKLSPSKNRCTFREPGVKGIFYLKLG